MTNNRDRALRLLNDLAENQGGGAGVFDAVTALAGAGLLAPDLPELSESSEAGVTAFGQVYIRYSVDDLHMTPAEAREIAYDLLAADIIEYGITFADESTVYWVGDDRDAAEGLREAWINRGDKVGPMVCRRVSEPWEVTNE